MKTFNLNKLFKNYSINKKRWQTSKENKIIQKILCFFIALLPILQHYNGFIMNASVSIMIFFLPYLLASFFFNTDSISKDKLIIVFPILLFFVYRNIRYIADIREIVLSSFMIFMIILLVIGAINIKMVLRYARYIAIVASLLIILQYICYYLFNFHLQLVIDSFLLESSSKWVPGVRSGLISITGVKSDLYRPSSFFLEPSHMYLYIFPLMLLRVFVVGRLVKDKIWMPILLSIGIILTTSGMGVLVVFGAWCARLLIFDYKTGRIEIKRIFNKTGLIILILSLLLFILLYFKIEIIKNSVDRIIFPKEGVSSAISGRVKMGNKLIKKMTVVEKIFGAKNSTKDITFNMSGFNATIYKFGIIGVVLSYWFYVKGLIYLIGPHWFINLIVFITSFFSAQTHGMFYYLYYTIFLIDGFNYLRTRGNYGRNNRS